MIQVKLDGYLENNNSVVERLGIDGQYFDYTGKVVQRHNKETKTTKESWKDVTVLDSYNEAEH